MSDIWLQLDDNDRHNLRSLRRLHIMFNILALILLYVVWISNIDTSDLTRPTMLGIIALTIVYIMIMPNEIFTVYILSDILSSTNASMTSAEYLGDNMYLIADKELSLSKCVKTFNVLPNSFCVVIRLHDVYVALPLS